MGAHKKVKAPMFTLDETARVPISFMDDRSEALATARDEALEEAAVLVERGVRCEQPLAAAIRALKGKP